MQLRHAIEKVKGLAYVFDCIETQSSIGRRFLLDMEYLKEAQVIENSLQETEQIAQNCFSHVHKDLFSQLKNKLSQLRDIKGTIERLFFNSILDDIELFEIKHFSLLSEEIAGILKKMDIWVVRIPNLLNITDILDPNKERVAAFYIYDSYSEELTSSRKQLQVKKNEIERLKQHDHSSCFGKDEKEIEDLFKKTEALEDEIRTEITGKLREYKKELSIALENLARLDVLIAKAVLAEHLNLCRPTVSDRKTTFKGIFHPYLKNILNKTGKQFQPVDIDFETIPNLITGANMSGKTILLKSVLLAQYLFQFGFFVPAFEAKIVPVEEILFCMDDSQSEKKGLSSFAAEMLSVNEILQTAAKGKNLLVLIDELARTTNPVEGRAIVNATLDMLGKYKIHSLITTHYSGITSPCRKLRVKGFVQGDTKVRITQDNINEYIDYSLTEESDEIVPMEALHIASILGVSEELLKRAENYIVNNEHA